MADIRKDEGKNVGNLGREGKDKDTTEKENVVGRQGDQNFQGGQNKMGQQGSQGQQGQGKPQGQVQPTQDKYGKSGSFQGGQQPSGAKPVPVQGKQQADKVEPDTETESETEDKDETS